MEATSSGKKPDKRTKGLSTPQRKERRQQQKREYTKRLVNIGEEQHNRWRRVRDRLEVSDEELARRLLDWFERPDSALSAASAPIRHQAHEMVSVASDVQSDEEGVEPLRSQAETHGMPSTSGGGSASSSATVAMEFEEPQADESEEIPPTSGQDTVSDQSLDISVKYIRKGDFIFPTEPESEDFDSSWDESNWEDERS